MERVGAMPGMLQAGVYGEARPGFGVVVIVDRQFKTDLDADRFIGADIGHGIGEDIGALLTEHAGGLARCLGFLEFLFGLFAFGDLRLDDALADGQL